MVIAPGESAVVELELIYYPAAGYDDLILGATFTIREGGIVGYGTVLERFVEEG